TLFIFTFVVIFALVSIHPTNLDMSTFVFQLGTAYSVISGLFFGSNVLEHFSQSPPRSLSGAEMPAVNHRSDSS
ncbi:MAG: hypothetical protein WCG26_11895, partial [Chloroflexales bacterium]